jgi:D-sedoheptulose 7-phosphate isomerase
MITGFSPYRDQVIATLQAGYKGSLGDVANVIYHAWKNGRPIVAIGNGGSMATALHFATDLRSIGIPVIDPPSVVDISRVANDYNYTSIFAFRRSDPNYFPLIVAFSCSGTSPNIVTVCRANDSILFTSTLYNPKLEGYAVNLVIRVYSSDYEIIEDIHLMMCHCLKKMLAAKLGDN